MISLSLLCKTLWSVICLPAALSNLHEGANSARLQFQIWFGQVYQKKIPLHCHFHQQYHSKAFKFSFFLSDLSSPVSVEVWKIKSCPCPWLEAGSLFLVPCFINIDKLLSQTNLHGAANVVTQIGVFKAAVWRNQGCTSQCEEQGLFLGKQWL